MLASYPQDKISFTDKPIKVLSLWGSNDQIADLNKVKDAQYVMPSDAESSVTNKQQMMDTSNYIIELLNSLNGSSEEK